MEEVYYVIVDGECVGFYPAKQAAEVALSKWSGFGAERNEHEIDIVDHEDNSAWNYCMDVLSPEEE